MPLECSSVVWTPIRPLFVLRRWGLAECDRALTPEAIRSSGNNTFIPYDAFFSRHPTFLATNNPKKGPRGTEETNCQSTAVKKEKYKPASTDTQMAIWMSDFHLVWMHSLTFALKDCVMLCKNRKTAALIIEIHLGAATRGILKYWLGRWQKINAGLITLQFINDDTVLFNLHITFVTVSLSITGEPQ